MVANADRRRPASPWNPAGAGEHGGCTLYLHIILRRRESVEVGAAGSIRLYLGGFGTDR